MSTFTGVLEFSDIGSGAWYLKYGDTRYQLDTPPEGAVAGDTVTVEAEEAEAFGFAMETGKMLQVSSIEKTETSDTETDDSE